MARDAAQQDLAMIGVEPGPTPRQLRVMEAYVRTGSQKAVAHECGISIQTVKNHMAGLYARLDAACMMEALTKLGWVALPGAGPTPCGWVAYCSRPRGHRGHHGGMRAFIRTEAPA
jgi:DNA-binding CsgD family transcriptional regulator